MAIAYSSNFSSTWYRRRLKVLFISILHALIRFQYADISAKRKRNITAISLYLFIFYSFAVLLAINAGKIDPSFFESLHAVMEVDLIFAGTVDLP